MIKALLTFVLLAALTPNAMALCLAPLCTCSVVTTSVAFGSFNPLTGLSHDSTGNVAVSCAGNNTLAGLLTPYAIALSTGSSNSYTTRRMASGTRFLQYNLYIDGARSVVWGDGTSGSSTTGGTMILDLLGLGATVNFPIYGRVLSGQNTAVPGIYSDTITVTLTYF